MSLLSRWIGETRSSIENPDTPISGELLASFGLNGSAAGVSVTPKTAMRISAVFRAVEILSGVIASMPLHAYEANSDGQRRPIAVPIIDDPHPDMTRMELLQWALVCRFLQGNACMIVHYEGGLPRWLEPVQPEDIDIVQRDAWKTTTNRLGVRYFISGERTPRTAGIGPGAILHLRGLTLDGVHGLSVISQAREGLGTAIAAQRFAAGMFKRGALIPGVLHTDQQLSQEDADTTRDRWRQMTTGPENHWKVPVLHKGLQFKGIAMPPRDAQYLEIREFEITDIARWFGLPPHTLGQVDKATSWGSGIEQQGLQMLAYTLGPELTRHEHRLSRMVVLGTDRRGYAKFNPAALLRTDLSTRYLAHQRAVMHGWESPNDVRDLEDMSPIDGGDQYFRPSNLTPLTERNLPDA